MVTVVIPGFSVKNKKWAEAAAKEIKLDHVVRPILWSHWEDSEKKFDPEEKANDIIDVLLKDQVNIIAKSIGTLVAIFMIKKINTRIEKVILCGIPLNDIEEREKEEIRNALKAFPVEKIICFQNQDDPHGSYDQVKKFLSEISPDIKLVLKSGEDHEYPYYSEFQSFLKNFEGTGF
jgi:predicted alpha/beta hydrolase family esterase